jgi:ribonuclease HII
MKRSIHRFDPQVDSFRDNSELFPRRQMKRENPLPGSAFGPELDFWSDQLVVIGTDEAGRGPLAGPVTAAAVSFSPDIRIDGITDSKKIAAETRERLSSEILAKALAWQIVDVSEKRIDQINILQATREAMEIAVRSVALKLAVSSPIILVDGRIPPLGIGQQINLIKGDLLSFTIGAASILAKVHRDQLMKKYNIDFPGYGFDHNMGYPTAFHISALQKSGPCPIHRMTFARVLPETNRPASVQEEIT